MACGAFQWPTDQFRAFAARPGRSEHSYGVGTAHASDDPMLQVSRIHTRSTRRNGACAERRGRVVQDSVIQDEATGLVHQGSKLDLPDGHWYVLLALGFQQC